MAGNTVPEIRASWDGVTIGTWCEGGECSIAVINSRTVVYEDDTWVRMAFDPCDASRVFVQSSEDAEVETTAEEILTRFRGYANLARVPK